MKIAYGSVSVQAEIQMIIMIAPHIFTDIRFLNGKMITKYRSTAIDISVKAET